MNKYLCGAVADIGIERENQEDFVNFKELDNEVLFCVIADGTGSKKEHPQPAPLVVTEIIDFIDNLYNEKKEIFLQDPEYFIKCAMLQANKLLGAFKMGNEEIYSGYAASVTCCLLLPNDKLCVAHTGNTRLYVIRNGELKQLTKDHTKAAKLLDEGKIDLNTYHVHPDRLKVTSGLGVVLDPEIQTLSGYFKENDLILMTTDGVHYAIQPNAMANIILNSANCENATANLIDAAKNIVKYPDNMTAMLIHKRN